MSLLLPFERHSLTRDEKVALRKIRRPLRQSLRHGAPVSGLDGDHQAWGADWVGDAERRNARGRAVWGVLIEGASIAAELARDWVIDAMVGHPAISDVADTPEGREIAGKLFDSAQDLLDGDD